MQSSPTSDAPLAMGYNSAQTPVLIDICASITTTSMTRQTFSADQQFEHPWLPHEQAESC